MTRCTRLDAGDGDACARRGTEQNREEGEGDTDRWGPVGIFIFFFFFFQGCDNSPPLRKSRPEILVDKRGRIKLGLG